MNQIPKGWKRELDGSYSPPKTAKQINAGQVGEVEFSNTGSAANPAPRLAGASDAKPARVGFESSSSRIEDKLNKTERRFLAILRDRNLGIPGITIRIQAITLGLADSCRYTADFSVTSPTRLTLYEVKGGFIREDAWIKLKAAARLYPELTFVMAQYKGGTWTEKEIKP